jgi:hypothetical protein
MKLSLEALRTRQSSRFDSRCPGSPYWIREELPVAREIPEANHDSLFPCHSQS